ncbi:MAG: MATE family efflux transporter [Clostridia bacterium]|nr:MATE family efflux transporter [Clostridia bacterium]
MKTKNSLTEGNILSSLIRFAIPVLAALFLQALYGGVDLLIVGRFSQTADVSGVATGSMIMHTLTSVITGLSMGITVLVGQSIGEKDHKKASAAIGSGICLFAVFAVILTALFVPGSEAVARFMQAPTEAFSQTVDYIRICAIGSVFIVAYNVLGSVFRGIGDSGTPLMTVGIACAANIVGDLLFVAVFDMGASGAAIATVIAQAVSVFISLLIIRKKQLPFTLSKKDLRFDKRIVASELRLGTPVALMDLLVGISFMVMQMIVNAIGVVESAGVGVAEKLCGFIMLVPSAYMQSMAAFVAQNLGAEKPKRAKKALFYGILTSFLVGAVMGVLAFFQGDLLAEIFSKEPPVITAAHSYLKAYAVDCFLTPFLFCFIGYFNGCGKSFFVMIQGLIGAFVIRVPLAFFISSMADVTLFKIGLATPASTVVQIALCLIMYFIWEKKALRNERS